MCVTHHVFVPPVDTSAMSISPYSHIMRLVAAGQNKQTDMTGQCGMCRCRLQLCRLARSARGSATGLLLTLACCCCCLTCAVWRHHAGFHSCNIRAGIRAALPRQISACKAHGSSDAGEGAGPGEAGVHKYFNGFVCQQDEADNSQRHAPNSVDNPSGPVVVRV